MKTVPLSWRIFGALSSSLLVALAHSGHAQEPQGAAEQMAFSHPYLGIDVDLPNGWEAQVAATGFLLVHGEVQEAIAVLSHEHSSLAALREAAEQGLREMGHVELMPESGLTPFGASGLAGVLEGTADGASVRAFAVFLLSPYSGGATVLVPLPSRETEEATTRLAKEVAQGIRFQPRVSADPLDPWKERLINCRLTHLPDWERLGEDEEATDAGVRRVVLDLCEDGSFHLAVPDDEALRERWTGEAALPTEATSRGNWALVRREGRAWLRLDFSSGARREFMLSFPDGRTLLDEMPVYRTYADALRIEDLPACD